MAGGHRANSTHENASSINLKGVRTENIVVRINVLINGYVVVRFSPRVGPKPCMVVCGSRAGGAMLDRTATPASRLVKVFLRIAICVPAIDY